MDLRTKSGRAELFTQVFRLLESINALEPDLPDDRPSVPLVGAMLETMTNERLIALLRYVLETPLAFEASRTLARRSDLFDKLIIMKGTERDWVLRLHTYNLGVVKRTPQEKKDMWSGKVKKGLRQSNLGGQLQDDEENTHLHRWRLSSRFVTGGFNNVTWDENHSTNPGKLLNKYKIPATVKTVGSGGSRVTENVGKSKIGVRRTELYQAGDIIVYPILDPHSVNSGLGALTGTTMTLAHTGKGLIEDSYFFAESDDVPTVAQLKFSPEELANAIILAITRLQLVELNNALRATDRRFAPLNSFETELLPRLAELIALRMSEAEAKVKPTPIDGLAELVDLPLRHLVQIVDMDPGALAHLVIESQQALWNQDFAKDGPDLLERFPPPELAKQALLSRDLQRIEPVNRIGPRNK